MKNVDLELLSGFKHIDEISKEDREKAQDLSWELQELLENNVNEPSLVAKAAMQQAQEIRKKLKKLGFLVKIYYSFPINSDALNIDVKVELSALRYKNTVN